MSQQMTPPQQQQMPSQQQVYNPEPEALRNLMVNYIPTTVDEMQLRQLFERYGPIETVKIVCDRETRQSRGYGFVKYCSAASAQQAVNELPPGANPAANMGYYGGNFAPTGYPQANPYAQQHMMAMQQQYMMQQSGQQPRQ
ncbi:putative RNA recognition motif (RRM, RBD, or RNP domain) [Leishmania utingensis]|uniref:RNA recognition motif (RRM, RBD, or RNP domain) n=1 Tax=Leishmania utingensis TaxID=653362 RepID=A0AAW3ADZ4_9TRYP